MSERSCAAKPAAPDPARLKAETHVASNFSAGRDPRGALRLPAAEERQADFRASVARRNETGLPDRLKAGIEALSGFSLDDVRVHYGSARPAQLRAEAFAAGTEIHLGPGQDRHLPHEAWHVVQQKQGRARRTGTVEGVAVNTEQALEREADVMGLRALSSLAPSVAAAGLARSAPPVAQAAAPGYGPLDASGWGTSADVILEPDYDSFKGSKPKVYPPDWPIPSPKTPDAQAAYDWARKFVVRGHLLNENLGGPGDLLENLTPITKSTNSTHAQVEKEVKTLVLDQGKPVHYRVEAVYDKQASITDMGGPDTLTAQQMILTWPGTIKADWTAYEWDSGSDDFKVDKANTPKGDLHIKNEGAHLKGPYT